MTVSRSTALPPGTTVYWAVDYDELGNEVVVGGPYYIPPFNTGPSGEVLDPPKKPTVASPPSPSPTIPADPVYNPSYPRTLYVAVRDGVRLSDNELYSTGMLTPGVISGWQSPEKAIGSDDQFATTNAPAGEYSSDLVLSGFDFSGIPANATITGIKVTVERNKI